MIVIKFGGHAMGSDSAWMNEIAAQFRSGKKFVIVHGGGPQIDLQLKAEGITSEFKRGFRITTPEVMKVVEAVLTGTVLRSVVRSLIAVGLPAVGIAGSDAKLLEVALKDDGNLGLVGEVVRVNPEILNNLIAGGFVPVVSPVSNDSTGKALNINADLAAGAIAGALGAEEMLFMTDVPGIFRNWPDKDSLISEISIDELAMMQFADGMVPKVAAAINAIRSGAKSVRVIDGKSLDAFHQALSGEGGTWVRK
jgi:acetylglutamate kinase